MTQWDDDEVELDEEERKKQEARERFEERQAKNEIKRLQRENAMLVAGVNPGHPAYSTFVKGYDGELEPDAIKTVASTIPGLLIESPKEPEPEPQPEPEPEVPAAEARFQQERERLASGSPPDTGISEAPDTVALRESEEIMRNGGTREDAMAHFAAKQIRAAMEGDERAINKARVQVVG